MEDSKLSAKDIVVLIRACKGMGVTELKFGSLHIRFSEQVTQEKPRDQVPKIPVETINQIEDETLESQESDIKQTQLELMLIENPAEYERLVQSGELDDREDTEERQEA